MVLLAMGVQTCRLHSDSLQSWPYCGRVSLSRPLALVSPSGSPATVCGPVQVVWHKFARYWDIEMREVPMAPGRYAMDPASMLERVA